MQKLLARYSDFRRFCLQWRKETREIDSTERKLETNRKLAASINTEKNYMQVDDCGNEEPSSGNDDGNKKNAASMSSTSSTSIFTRSNMDRCRLCSIKEDEDDKKRIELVEEMDRSLDLTIMEPEGRESLKYLDPMPCDPNTIVEKLKFLRGKGQIIRQTIRRLEIEAKRNARRLREVCSRLPISSVRSAVLSVFDGMERNMTVSSGDNNRKVKLEAATSCRVFILLLETFGAGATRIFKIFICITNCIA